MPKAYDITPEMRRIIQDGRAAKPPRPWKEIAAAIGVKSWRTPINMAIRLGIYKRVQRSGRYAPDEGSGGKAEVIAAWERMASAGLIRPGRQPPSL